MNKTVTVRNTTLGDGVPKICVPVTSSNPDGIHRECIHIVQEGADLVEWRVDYLRDFDNANLVANILLAIRRELGETPLIFTLRTKNEGGTADVKLWDYIKVLRAAAKTGCVDIIDVELWVLLQLPQEILRELQSACKIIASKHHFDMTPSYEKMVDDMIRMQVFGADIAKLAVMPMDDGDVRRLYSASIEMATHHTSTPIVTISMGELGLRSRIECVHTGSCMTFAALEGESAPGQIPIHILREEMEAYVPPKKGK